MQIEPAQLDSRQLHAVLLGAVAPRPIAFAATTDAKGRINLSPFSFFNCFGSNPPVLIFSPSRRVRDNTTKHTLENVLQVPEVTINIVNFQMGHQMNLASAEFPEGVNEFEKAGFSALPSLKVRPPRVEESPVAFECVVTEVKPLGEKGGAGNLVICEVLMIHVKDDVLDSQGAIDPVKLDAIGRMGGSWYVRAQQPSIFSLPKHPSTPGIGVNDLPDHAKNLDLSGAELALLASITHVPEVNKQLWEPIIEMVPEFPEISNKDKLQLIRQFLDEDRVELAWQVVLQT